MDLHFCTCASMMQNECSSYHFCSERQFSLQTRQVGEVLVSLKHPIHMVSTKQENNINIDTWVTKVQFDMETDFLDQNVSSTQLQYFFFYQEAYLNLCKVRTFKYVNKQDKPVHISNCYSYNIKRYKLFIKFNKSYRITAAINENSRLKSTLSSCTYEIK